MIESLAPVARASAISAAELCELIPLDHLNGRVTYRVATESMRPTLEPGDVLTIGPAVDLQPGDLLVYSVDRQLVCHRLRRYRPGGGLLVSGDAAPDCTDSIDAGQVRGKVTTVARAHIPPGTRLRAAIGNGLRRLLLSRAGSIPCLLLKHLVTTSVRVHAPVQSFPLSREVHRMRGMSPHDIRRSLDCLALQEEALSIHVTLGPFNLGTFDRASGQLEVGPVGCRLGVDRALARSAETPTLKVIGRPV